MFKKFLKEEKAQGAIEYILLAGGIIVAAVVIFVIYKNIAKTTGEKANETVEAAAEKINETVSEELAKL
ncbi:Flp family type IVb pilin [Candidatus Pyrohabitans sp.]